MQSISSGEIGRKLIDVLQFIFETTVTTKSDFSRFEADTIAMAASLGLITTRITGDVFGREWRVTARGLTMLETFDE